MFSTRIAADGTDLGPHAPISLAGPATFPSITSSGAGYGVAWTEGTGTNAARRFALVDAAGARSGDVIPVGPGRSGAVVWNGDGYGLSGRPDSGTSDQISVAHLNPAGVLIGETTITTSASSSAASALAWTGAEYAVAWTDARDPQTHVHVRRSDTSHTIGPDLRVSDVSAPARNPRIVWTGIEYGMVWIGEAGGASTVYFDFVACGCLDRDADGFDSCEDCNDSDPQIHPGVAEVGCDGADNDCDPATPDIFSADGDPSSCAIDCDDSDPEVGPHLDEFGCDGKDNDCDAATGDVLDADGDGFACDVDCDDADALSSPGLAERTCDTRDNDCDPQTPDLDDADGDGFHCLDECDDSDAAVFPGAVELGCDQVDNDCDGVIDPPEVLVQLNDGSSVARYAAAMAWSGTRLGVAWIRYSGGGDVPFTILDEFGGEISQTILPIPPLDYPINPSVAWTGTQWFVAISRYNDPSDLWLYRIARDGALIESRPLEPESNNTPRIASAGTGHAALVWATQAAPAELKFRRLAGNGDPIGPTRTLAGSSFDPNLTPDLVATDTGFAVAWRDPAVRFMRLDDVGVPVGPSVQLDTRGRRPSLAWSGTDYGLAWDDNHNGNGVHFARLDATGNVLSEDVVSSDVSAREPSVAWTGTSWAVSWQYNGDLHLTYYDALGNRVGQDIPLFARAPQEDDHSQVLVSTTSGLALLWTASTSLTSSDLLLMPLACTCHDADGDGVVDCDDCDDADPTIAEFMEGDGDGDGISDVCDLDDGLLFVRFASRESLAWHPEGFPSWNLYRGNLGELLARGAYTQDPAQVPEAAQFCALPQPATTDAFIPAAGAVAFYLATGVDSGQESDLGLNSTGQIRVHAHPCR